MGQTWRRSPGKNITTQTLSWGALFSGLPFASAYSVWGFLFFKMVSKYLICMQFSDESTSHPVFPSEASRIFVQSWSRYLYP